MLGGLSRDRHPYPIGALRRHHPRWSGVSDLGGDSDKLVTSLGMSYTNLRCCAAGTHAHSRKPFPDPIHRPSPLRQCLRYLYRKTWSAFSTVRRKDGKVLTLPIPHRMQMSTNPLPNLLQLQAISPRRLLLIILQPVLQELVPQQLPSRPPLGRIQGETSAKKVEHGFNAVDVAFSFGWEDVGAGRGVEVWVEREDEVVEGFLRVFGDDWDAQRECSAFTCSNEDRLSHKL